MWLAQPEIANIVRDALHCSDLVLYRLYVYVIMANHVHVLLGPAFDEETQRPVPLRIRNPQEFERAAAYIVNNPVKAGLVEDWGDWPWTWIAEELVEDEADVVQ